MGFSIETSVSAMTVFIQGLISFFSPCVLPLVPLYISYLAGGTKSVETDGTIRYKRSRIMLNTLFFIIGVSFAFFLLGLGFTALGRFFSGNKTLFIRIGGFIIILFGLYQLGIFGSKLLGQKHRLPLRLDKLAMNPFVALLLGFTFSFAWTPCVGPALTSVLIMASSANSSAIGFLFIGLYTLGFVLPFLAVGLFTGSLLDFFKKHQKAVQYTAKVGGVLLILMGIMMLTGWMNGITGYLSGIGNNSPISSSSSEATPSEEENPAATSIEDNPSSSGEEREKIPAPDFVLTDQYGNTQTLSDYKGKVVFLNFWATWCGPCRQEMPDIQALFEDSGKNQSDLVVLGVANPRTEESPQNADVSVDEITDFLSDNGYSYPVAMDTTGDIFAAYGIQSFPTTFMIDKEGNVFGYISGTLTREIMDSIVKQTLEGKRS